MGPTWAIVVAAGSGRRYGGAKQYASVGGRTLVARAVEAARLGGCDGVVVVVPPGDEDRPLVADTAPDAVVAGGTSRSASVRAGLAAVPAEAAIVIVHDAARPLATPALFRSVLEAVLGGADAAVPGIPVADTLKRVDGGQVVATVDRSSLVAVQTPQAFRAGVLRRAHAGGGDATDDAALVEAAGGKVVTVAGDPHNLKVTTAGDLALADALLR